MLQLVCQIRHGLEEEGEARDTLSAECREGEGRIAGNSTQRVVDGFVTMRNLSNVLARKEGWIPAENRVHAAAKSAIVVLKPSGRHWIHTEPSATRRTCDTGARTCTSAWPAPAYHEAVGADGRWHGLYRLRQRTNLVVSKRESVYLTGELASGCEMANALVSQNDSLSGQLKCLRR